MGVTCLATRSLSESVSTAVRPVGLGETDKQFRFCLMVLEELDGRSFFLSKTVYCLCLQRASHDYNEGG